MAKACHMDHVRALVTHMKATAIIETDDPDSHEMVRVHLHPDGYVTIHQDSNEIWLTPMGAQALADLFDVDWLLHFPLSKEPESAADSESKR